MFYILEIIIFVLLLAFWWYKNDKKEYSTRPPGPLRLPIVGNIPQIMWKSDFPAESFRQMADKHGDVMFLKMGGHEAVVFTSIDAIREVLSHESANNRIQYAAIADRHDNKNLGLIWSNGEVWQTLRRFTMRNLRDYGFGKSAEMETVISEELVKFVAHIKFQSENAPGNILHVTDMFEFTLVNVVWALVTGKSFEYDDEKLLKWLEVNDKFFKSFHFALDITSIFPQLRYWFPNWSGRNLAKECIKAQYDYGKKLLDEQRQLMRDGAEPECFIDVFATKLNECSDDPDTVFTEEQLVITILDLMVGGSETSSKTLSFGILYMLLNPEVQAKIQQELDRELPFGAPVRSSMKPKLPYTTAAVLEMMRMSTILPTPSARESTADFYFRGHLIKKGSSIITNVYAVHNSRKLWGDPENFRPERFLNKEETAVEKKTADLLQSFGAGRRVCLGLSLAESTTFMYLATMVKHFTFELVPGTKPTTKPLQGVAMSPHPFDVKVTWRQNASLK